MGGFAIYVMCEIWFTPALPARQVEHYPTREPVLAHVVLVHDPVYLFVFGRLTLLLTRLSKRQKLVVRQI
jgi:hypothetical protein